MSPLLTEADPARPLDGADTSSRRRWAGRVLSGIAVLFLTFDVVIKLVRAAPAIQGTVELGFAPHHVLTIGLIGLVCLILYVIPRTAPLGAVLWTGYFGGAIAVQLRLDEPLFSHILTPIYIAVLVWGGLYLRDERVRALFHDARQPLPRNI
ncbi:MAG: DoxX family protein [Gemmatimonadota bacterium]|nr:DoxX family protein [Gemmatimonadota bacterium]